MPKHQREAFVENFLLQKRLESHPNTCQTCWLLKESCICSKAQKVTLNANIRFYLFIFGHCKKKKNEQPTKCKILFLLPLVLLFFSPAYLHSTITSAHIFTSFENSKLIIYGQEEEMLMDYEENPFNTFALYEHSSSISVSYRLQCPLLLLLFNANFSPRFCRSAK
jgi:hypothetical protein